MQGEFFFSRNEITILRCLESRRRLSKKDPVSEIAEISFRTGIEDHETTLRSLYTLEGQRLVEPHPPGKFTSNYWKITNSGAEAIKEIEDNEDLINVN